MSSSDEKIEIKGEFFQEEKSNLIGEKTDQNIQNNGQNGKEEIKVEAQ